VLPEVLAAEVTQFRGAAATQLDREAVRLVESFTRFPVLELTLGLALAAMSTSRRFQISYWDAAIIEAADALGCRVVLSEDLYNGQEYDGVRIEDPFR
jgi:predicted nucleic acid-binding protein